MRADLVVIGRVILQNATQLRLVEHDQVIETFAPNRADEPLDEAVLPRRTRVRWGDPSAMHERGVYKQDRMRRRDREADEAALRPTEKRRSSDRRSTGPSDWQSQQS